MLSSRFTRPLKKPGQALKFLPAGLGGYDTTNGVLYGSYGEALTFVRATTATYADAAGNVFSVASGQPRVAPGLGYLSELASTNLILRSQALSNAAWTSLNSGSVTDNANVAPDGTSTAATFNDTDASFQFGRYQNLGGLAGTYTFSVWLKAGTVSSAFIDVSTDATSSSQLNCALTSSWQRFSVTYTTTLSTFTRPRIFVGNLSGGALMGTIQVWGAQFEQKGYASSYIPTTSATVTRNADQLTTATPAAWPIASGSVSFKFTPTWTTGPTGNEVMIGSLQASVQGFQLRILTTGALQLQMGDGTLTATASSALVWVPGQQYSIRFTWGAGNRAIFRDGVSVATSTADRMPTTIGAATTGFGNQTDGTAQVDGWISDLLVRAT